LQFFHPLARQKYAGTMAVLPEFSTTSKTFGYIQTLLIGSTPNVNFNQT